MFHKKSLNVAILAGAIALVLIFGIFVAQQQAQGPAQPQQPPDPMPTVLQNYKPVGADRLKKPEDGDWLTVRRTYDGWGYSPLEQITTKNVEKPIISMHSTSTFLRPCRSPQWPRTNAPSGRAT